MPIATIKARTHRGVVQAILTTGLTAPLGFGLVVMLSHISAAAAGYYGLLTLIVGFSGLGAGGGVSVAARFGSTDGPLPNRVTYGQSLVAPLIAGGIAVLTAMQFGLPGGLTPVMVGGLLTLSVVWTARQGEYTADLRFGRATLLQSLPTMIQCAAVIALLVIGRDILEDQLHTVLFGLYVVPLGLVAGWQVAHLWRQRRPWRRRAGSSGLWRYVTETEIMLALSILFISAERYPALAASDGLRTLGIYIAIYQVAELVRRVPNLIASALLPGLRLLDTRGQALRYHLEAGPPIAVFSFMVGSAVICGAGWIVRIYGPEFRQATLGLGILGVAFGSTAVSALDMTYTQATKTLMLYNLCLVVGLMAFVPLPFVPVSVTAYAVLRGCAVVGQQATLAAGIRHVRWQRARGTVMGLLIGVAEIAILRRSGYGIEIGAPLWIGGAALYLWLGGQRAGATRALIGASRAVRHRRRAAMVRDG